YSGQPVSRSGMAPTSREAASRSIHGVIPTNTVDRWTTCLLMRSCRLDRMVMKGAPARPLTFPRSDPMCAKAAPAPPTSRMSDAERRRGFTLIELLAVMLIIALAASLTISWMTGTGRARLKAVALEAAALLRRERTHAILSGHAQQIVLDGE